MIKKIILTVMILLTISLIFTGCNITINDPEKDNTDIPEIDDSQTSLPTSSKIPTTLTAIPREYRSTASEQGTLILLWYDTYESFSYVQKDKTITKRAIVYLPYDYSEEKQYNVMYMMHGGWSNETTTLGIPNRPTTFKNVIDNAIENKVFDPLIIVCPTYNNTNTNGQDSDNYSLAQQLNRNYHNELVNDLMPAVEGKYSTFSEGTTKEEFSKSRDHRAFCGFSMGSVATWRTFENCLAYFRYFFPSSGAISTDRNFLDNIVKTSGYDKSDFFIWGMSGTRDFAYSQFTNQMQTMFTLDSYTEADNEKDGNIAYTIKEGYSHDVTAQTEYFYNALSWVWQGQTSHDDYDINTKITDVINDPIFKDFGRLIFPVNNTYYSGDTLGNLRMTWYNNINPTHTVEICNYFKEQVLNGEQLFYDIYTEKEKEEDPQKNNTGLFFFKGNKGAKMAITCAGGGWAYVGAMHDSFPHALELSKKGYNAFAIIYRPGAQTAYQDLARAISFIFKNAEQLGVDPYDYSLWGGSAGGRMVATISSYGVQQYGGSEAIPKPSAAIIQYTGHQDYNESGEVPTFVTVGENDGIANYLTMKRRIDNISNLGVETEYHSYPGLGHGFGLGVGTISEGWFEMAVNFWENTFKE